MTERISKDIVDLQDIEKIQFLKTLQADPAKYSAYVQTKSGRILSETVDTKRASFEKVSGDMARIMDMDHNSIAALIRTGELANTQEFIIKEQQRQQQTINLNKDISRRQVEINNWYYENKRESLFVLQLTLIVMLTIVVILAFGSYGIVGQAGANLLIAGAILVGAGTWIYRWYYTSYIRDPRYWNHRTFPEDGVKDPPLPECAPLSGSSGSSEESVMSMSDIRSLSGPEATKYVRSLSPAQLSAIVSQYKVMPWEEFNTLTMERAGEYMDSLTLDQQSAQQIVNIGSMYTQHNRS
jgi:hypothetical protein